MLGKKLISFLSGLSQNELDKFSKFLDSPYHNEQKDLINIFTLIKPGLPHSIEKIPKKRQIWANLYPKKPYNDLKIRKLVSSLLTMAISFKSYELLNQQPEQKLLLALKSVSRADLNIHIASINRKLEKFLNQKSLHTAEAHFYAFEFEAQNHRILEKGNDLKQILKLENLQKANKHLDIFYLSKKLEVFSDALGYQGVAEINNSLAISSHFLADAQNSPHIQEPIVKVYFLIVLLLSQPENNEHFSNLKTWLSDNQHHFDKKQGKTFYTHLLNFCIQHRINAGDKSFYKESFEIFKILIEKDLIFDPYIEPSYYQNIITNGVRLKQYDYVQNFISQYSKFLPPEQKENADTYNLARLYYGQKKYMEVIQLLQNVELNNISYAIGAKTILIGTFYALDEFRALESLIISFRVYVLRNKILSTQAKKSCLNFLKHTKKLVFLADFDKDSFLKLRDKVLAAKDIIGRDWLLEQIETKL